MHEPMRSPVSVVLFLINLCGLLLLLPILMAIGMSFDSVEGDAHWSHELFVFGNLAFPVACIIGLCSKNSRWAGLAGLGLAGASWFVFMQACDGQFACR